MTQRALALVLAACCGALSAAPARADVIRVGSTIGIITAPTRGSDVSFDGVSKVYLVVSAAGIVRGRFIQADGTPLGTAFQIQASANYAHFPRVAFSPDADGGAGAFLVTWHESDLAGGATSIHGRMVSYTRNGAYGNDTQLAPEGSWWEAGAAVAYSTRSREFLVAWRRIAGNDIRAARVDNSAVLKDAVFNVTSSADYENNVSIAYNPADDEYMLVYAGFNDPGNYAFVDARRVKAGVNQVLGASATRLTVAAGSYITDVTYNPVTGKYLASWYSLPGGASFGRVLNADASIAGDVIVLSTRWKAYDALNIAYNTKSDSFFLVSHSSTAEDGGVEIKTDGTPVDNGILVTAAGGTGNFYPRITASSDQPDWLLSTANGFSSTMIQRLVGHVSASTPVVTPNPAMSLERPLGSVVRQPFLVGGWTVDFGALAGTGADAVHVWAWPVGGGSPTWAGSATMGGYRPDVGAAFGAQFTYSGYNLMVSGLRGGTYILAVYMHSTVSGTFNLARTMVVTIADPLLDMDTPVENMTVASSGFLVAGWAIDRAASSGAGVDTMHVWAIPTGGGSPIWVGVPAKGGSRPDVGAVFGTQFTNSGFYLVVSTLPPGQYQLVVYAHSVVTGTFSAWKVVHITVQ